jgi:hypothetical protein
MNSRNRFRVVHFFIAGFSYSALLGTSVSAQDGYSSNLILQSRPSDFVLQLPASQPTIAISSAASAPKPPPPTPVSDTIVSSVCDRLLWSPVSLTTINGLQCLRSERF